MSNFKVQMKPKEKDILTLSHFDIPLTFGFLKIENVWEA